MVYAVEDKRRNTSTNELEQLRVCSFLCNVIIVILSYIFNEFWQFLFAWIVLNYKIHKLKRII